MMPHVPAAEPRYRRAFVWALLLPWSALLTGPLPINHDVAWFFYVARGVLRGGTLYRDFIEPNTPLVSLSLVPAVLLGHLLAIGPGLAVELTTLGIASAAMALCLAVLRCLRVQGAALLFALLALTVAFAFLPKPFFGQREHILSMLLTPYILASVVACTGARLPPLLACAIGVAAAIAVGLKPPFVLVPGALELMVLLHAGPRQRLRAEPVVLGIVLLLITATTMLFFPLYFSEVVPWAVALYGGYDSPNDVIFNFSCILAGSLVLWLIWPRNVGTAARALRNCLAAAILAALVAFTVQGKGWPYQAFPAFFFAFLFCAGAIAMTGWRPPPSLGARLRWGAARLMLVAFGWYLVNVPARGFNIARYADVASAIAAQPGPFLILSTDVVPAFPLTLEENRVWASRTPCLIMLPGLVKAEAHGQTSPWENTFRAWINADLRRYRPTLVFVPTRPDQALPPHFDILTWLLHDPSFAATWSHYHEDGQRDGFRLFRLS